MLNRRTLIILAGVMTFAVALAILVGSRMTSGGAMAVALGVAVGVLVGVPAGMIAGMLVVRGQVSIPARDSMQPEGTTSIILTSEQADKLLRILSSRQQASPDDFPIIVDREREFSAVGGASIEEDEEM